MKPLLTFPEGDRQKAELMADDIDFKDYNRLEKIGVPRQTSGLISTISLGLSTAGAASWRKCLIKVIPVGIDLRPAHYRFMARLLTDPRWGAIRFADERGRAVIKAAANLYIRAERDDYPKTEEWTAARAEAWYAAKAVSTSRAAKTAVEVAWEAWAGWAVAKAAEAAAQGVGVNTAATRTTAYYSFASRLISEIRAGRKQ